MKTLTEQVREIKEKLAENPNYFDDSNMYISPDGIVHLSDLEKKYGKEDIIEDKPKTAGYFDYDAEDQLARGEITEGDLENG